MHGRIMRGAVVGALATATLLSFGCGGADRGESGAPESFALASVNGQPLPFTNKLQPIEGTSCRPTFTAGRLDLKEGNGYALTYDLREACMKEGVVNTENKSEDRTGLYERQGDQMRFYAGEASADSTSEEPVMQGVVKGDSLSLFLNSRQLTFGFVRSDSAAAKN